ncbi:alpha/beta hydrolase fold domain-containing protein [Subtercola boreus]|uniref:Alpha/beta hydrolase fold-3 domain-containing protein n=1 Tax=Subtercola boreus TaxID=120213 RepID=A0A3E0W9R1_9MICO|nr:alpha/beta hydrolase fold domain-containing protein [Subtercola boreus]RFA20532.1 hypothetical protein B7R24_08840 [Subtercola boreus]RFA20647.1 hypothetical protein B7R23_08775 [Subtercola boreus]RFA26857.1 hypothetical protein B7R25_08905 [Subtercola boreus]
MNGAGLLLTTAEMEWYWDLYVPDERRRLEPEASPLRRTDLSGVAPATLVIAGGDPLRDEGVEYGLRLRSAGVPEYTCIVAGVPHLFLTFPALESRTRAIDEVSERLRLSFAGG